MYRLLFGRKGQSEVIEKAAKYLANKDSDIIRAAKLTSGAQHAQAEAAIKASENQARAAKHAAAIRAASAFATTGAVYGIAYWYIKPKIDENKRLEKENQKLTDENKKAEEKIWVMKEVNNERMIFVKQYQILYNEAKAILPVKEHEKMELRENSLDLEMTKELQTAKTNRP